MFGKFLKNKQKKILIYCGVHDCEALNGIIGNFDYTYGFDANLEKIERARVKYKERDDIEFIHGALTAKDGDEVEFKITSSWDASSSMGDLNPDFPSYADPESPLHDTPIKTVKVKTLNLYNFCRRKKISFIHTLITDLQGMDYTVLQTLKPMIDQNKIGYIRCEVEKDESPIIYAGIPSNKKRLFDELLKEYEVIKIEGKPEWWECDIEWKLKGFA